MKKLASSDIKEQEEGKLLADQILEGNSEKEFTGDGEVRIKTNRTVINKSSTNNDSTSNSKGRKNYFPIKLINKWNWKSWFLNYSEKWNKMSNGSPLNRIEGP